MISLARYAHLLALPDVLQAFVSSFIGRIPIGIAGLAILLLVQSVEGSYAQAGLVGATYVAGLAADGQIEPGGRFDVMTRLFSRDGFNGLFDGRGHIDKTQIEIFNRLYEKVDLEKIKSVLDFTDRLGWEPERELALAQALAFPDQTKYWQAVFGEDLIPNGPKVVAFTKNGDLWLKQINGLKGSIVIDPANQKIMLTNLYDRQGRFAEPARAFSFKTQSFAAALAKARQVVMAARRA